MNWDSSRPVPWQRLFREAAIYALIVGGVFIFVFKNQTPGSIVSGLVFGVMLYLTVGWVMAKLGIERKTAAERKAERAAMKTGTTNDSSPSDDNAGSRPRPKPAPTRRTNATPATTKQKRRKR